MENSVVSWRSSSFTNFDAGFGYQGTKINITTRLGGPQIRSKINAMPFGDHETTTGGNALKFYASLRLDVRKVGSLKRNEDLIGNRVRVKVAKNKVRSIKNKVIFLDGDIKRVARKIKERFDVIAMPRPQLKDSFLKDL